MELENNNLWKPNVIVLGPGGAKGYLLLGALSKLEKENYLNNVDKWQGVSIGAAASLMKVAGYSIDEIIQDCIDLNLIKDITNINLGDFSSKMGLMKNESLEKILKKRMDQKFGFVPTLHQLYMATGIIFESVTFNIDKMRTEYLNENTEPNLCCVNAVMMSMAIPFLFQPRKYKGCLYIDGAIGDPYPVLRYDNGENKILGLYISSETNLLSSDKIPTNFIYKVIQASMKSLRDEKIEWSSDNCKHIGLKTLIKDTTGISLSNDNKKEMINQGYENASLFLEKLKNPNKFKIILEENEEIPTISQVLKELIGHDLKDMVNKLQHIKEDAEELDEKEEIEIINHKMFSQENINE